MPLPDRGDFQDNIVHNQTPGHQTTRACAIFSGETFRFLDHILQLPVGRRRNAVSAANQTRQYRSRVDDFMARFRQEFQDIRKEFGWDPLTKTIDVIDPEYLPPGHPIVFPPDSPLVEHGMPYDEMFRLVWRSAQNEGGETIYRIFRDRGITEAMREFIRVAVHTVYVGEVDHKPHAVFDKVYVQVGIQGTWDSSSIGRLVPMKFFEVNRDAYRLVKSDFGLAPTPNENVGDLLDEFRTSLGCPESIDSRYEKYLKVKKRTDLSVPFPEEDEPPRSGASVEERLHEESVLP